MPSNTPVVSERLLSRIAQRYILLASSGEMKEAEDYINRLDPTPSFLALLRKQIKKEILG